MKPALSNIATYDNLVDDPEGGSDSIFHTPYPEIIRFTMDCSSSSPGMRVFSGQSSK